MHTPRCFIIGLLKNTRLKDEDKDVHERMNFTLNSYVRENVFLYLFVTVLFLVGVGFGAILVNELTSEQKEAMTQHVSQYVKEFTLEYSGTSKQTFWDTLLAQLKWIFFIWLFGLSVIGIPLILILDFLKGVFVGFSIGYLISQLSWKGLCLAIVSIAPHNALVIPALLVCSVAAIVFSVQLVKNRLVLGQASIYQSFWKFTRILLGMSMCLIFAAAWEVYIAPVSIRWMMPKLGLF